jgi:acyl dehydratase
MVPIVTPRFDAVRVGDALPAQRFPVQRINLIMYAGASGDFNPIHWNERFAKLVGLPDVIAQGMFTMAEAGRVLTDFAGDPARVVHFGVRFTRPVLVPDDDIGAVVEVSGEVVDKRDDGTVVIDLTATCGEDVVLGKATGVVRLS